MNRRFLRVGVALATVSLWSSVAISAHAVSLSAGSPVKVGEVFFAPNSAALSSSAKSTLTTLAPKLAGYSDVTLTGYIQKTGTTQVLKKLGLERAVAVKTFLVGKGVKVALKTVGATFEAKNATAASARNVTITGVATSVGPKGTLTVTIYSSIDSFDRVDKTIACSSYKFAPTSLSVTGPSGYSKNIAIPAKSTAGSDAAVGPITTAGTFYTCTYTVIATGIKGGTYTLTLHGQDSTANTFGGDDFVLAPSVTPVNSADFRSLNIDGYTSGLLADTCTDAPAIATEPVTVAASSGSTSTYLSVSDPCN